MSKLFYVYSHTDPRTNELVYIGKGVHGRAWDVTRCRGCVKEHEDWMKELCSEGYLPIHWTEIVAFPLTEQEAFAREKALIHENDPVFNRSQSGERNYQAKLTNEQAKEIFLSEENSGVLSRKYGVSRACIQNIKTRKQWRAVTACLITQN